MIVDKMTYRLGDSVHKSIGVCVHVRMAALVHGLPAVGLRRARVEFMEESVLRLDDILFRAVSITITINAMDSKTL